MTRSTPAAQGLVKKCACAVEFCANQPGITAMRLRHLCTALLALTLSACANSDYFEPTPLADSGNAMVYVYRPAANNPGKKPLTLSYPEVIVDGNSVGFLKYKKYLAIEVEPGKRHFRVTGLTQDARWEPKDREYTLETEAGKSYFLRFGVEFDTKKMSLDSFRGQYIITFHPVPEGEVVYEIRHTDPGNN